MLNVNIGGVNMRQNKRKGRKGGEKNHFSDWDRVPVDFFSARFGLSTTLSNSNKMMFSVLNWPNANVKWG